MPSLRDELEAGLEYEPNSGCWLWSRGTDTGGYGRMGGFGRQRTTHRVAWEVYRGTLPPWLMVLHRCDTPACCNPDHLFLGTALDNVRDMMAKGRAKPPPNKRRS